MYTSFKLNQYMYVHTNDDLIDILSEFRFFFFFFWHSLALGYVAIIVKGMIFKLIIRDRSLGTPSEIALRWMSYRTLLIKCQDWFR